MDIEAELRALKKNQKKKDFSLVLLIAKPFVLFLLPFLLVLSVFPGPTGKPILDWADLLPEVSDFNFLHKWVGEIPIASNPLKPEVKVYHYKDEKGRVVFTNEPPKGVKAETMLVNTELNLIPPPPEINIPEPEETKSGASLPSINGIGPLNVLQEAKKVQEMADERNKVLQQF